VSSAIGQAVNIGGGLALLWPNGLGTPANPLEAPANAKPEWYYLSLYQHLRVVPERVGIIVPTVIVVLMILLPFVDRSRERAPAAGIRRGRRPSLVARRGNGPRVGGRVLVPLSGRSLDDIVAVREAPQRRRRVDLSPFMTSIQSCGHPSAAVGSEVARACTQTTTAEEP